MTFIPASSSTHTACRHPPNPLRGSRASVLSKTPGRGCTARVSERERRGSPYRPSGGNLLWNLMPPLTKAEQSPTDPQSRMGLEMVPHPREPGDAVTTRGHIGFGGPFRGPHFARRRGAKGGERRVQRRKAALRPAAGRLDARIGAAPDAWVAYRRAQEANRMTPKRDARTRDPRHRAPRRHRGPPRAPPSPRRVTVSFHVTLAPAWFDPSTAPPQITPSGEYAIHDALVRPAAGQKIGASLAESWSESRDGLVYDSGLRTRLRFTTATRSPPRTVKFQLRPLQRRRRAGFARRAAARRRRSAHVRFTLKEHGRDFQDFYGTTPRRRGFVPPKKYFDRSPPTASRPARRRRPLQVSSASGPASKIPARGQPHILAPRALHKSSR